MATRQITIDDGSKARPQVNFDLQPLALRPVIAERRYGPVNVQATPLTNQAEQLKDLLTGATELGKGYAKIQKQIGLNKAGAIAGEDAKEELKRLKAEEPETWLNITRQKAYSSSLIEKHIRTQMVPNVVQKMGKTANASLYKTKGEFDAAVDAQLTEAWNSFVGDVGGDIANTTEGQTLWTTITDGLKVQAEATYYESQDAVALSNKTESLEHRVSSMLSPTDLDGNQREVSYDWVSDFTKTGIKELMEENGLSRPEASAQMREIFARKLEKLYVEGKNLAVVDLHDAMMNTVSKDGVRIYDDAGPNSLSIAKHLASARKAIEDDEDKTDDISAQEQNIFKGQYTYATGKLANGVRFNDLTPQGKQLVLAPLQNADPTYTMEMLEAAMAPQGEGDAGGGLTEFENILQGIAINGSDYGRNIILGTANARNSALLTSSQLKGPPRAIRDLDQRGQWEQAYRNQRKNDPDLTLMGFLDEHNIQSWPALDTLDTKMAGVNQLVLSEAYSAVGARMKKQADGIYSTMEENEKLGLVTSKAMTAMVASMAERIQNTLEEEVVAGELLPEDFSKRGEELQDIALRNLSLILAETSGSDLSFQTRDVPDAGIAQQEMERDVFEGERSPKRYLFTTESAFTQLMKTQEENPEMEGAYRTNASKFKEVKEKRDGRAFGVIPLYDTFAQPWTAEEIATEREDMLERYNSSSSPQQYADALSYSLYSHGADIMEDADNVLKMLEATQMDAMDVALFKSQQEVPMFTEAVMDVFDKLLASDNLSETEIKTLDQAKALGLIVGANLSPQEFAQRIYQFETAQGQLIQQHVR